MKRKLAIFLTSALFMPLFSLSSCGSSNGSTSVTEGSFTYEIVSDHATITGCSRDVVGDMVVPDNINGVPVTAIGPNAFSKCFTLKSVTIPSSVKKVGSCAFDSCKTKDSGDDCHGGALYIRNTMQVTIENVVFRNCYSEDDGGAIYCENRPGIVKMTNVTFENNEAKDRGGAIRIGGRIQAFGFGKAINDVICDENVEKANPEIRGLYTAIQKECAEKVWTDMTYINREEDMGSEGLRKAKEALHPAFMVKKYNLLVR